jgi:hypothetical protein
MNTQPLVLQEIDLEVHEAILAEELEQGLRPSDGAGPINGTKESPCACGQDCY